MSIINGSLKGVAVFFLGMNFIGLLMKLNGSNNSSNLAWSIVSAAFKIELIIAFIAGLALVAWLFFRLHEKCQAEEIHHRETEEKQRDSVSASYINVKSYDELCSLKSTNTTTSNIKINAKNTAEATTKKHLTSETKTSLPPNEISKEELRKRVLRELTGRSD